MMFILLEMSQFSCVEGLQRTALGPRVLLVQTTRTSRWLPLWKHLTLHELEKTSSSTWCLILKK